MKTIFGLIAAMIITLGVFAQPPQKLSYQAVIRNSAGKLIQNGNVGLRISINHLTPAGTCVYSETHSATTNVNGLLTVEIGGGTVINGDFSLINWAAGPFFLKTEVDPSGAAEYSITSVTQLLSVPYALYSAKAGNGFSGNYNDLTNKPVTDGSETKIQAGANIKVAGIGTSDNPYIIYGTPGYLTTVFTTSSTFSVPSKINKIQVELWGASGGGAGAGTYSYSLRNGGDGGSGGYCRLEMFVNPNQQLSVTVGQAGTAGTNGYYSGGYWYGDTDGGKGGDSEFNGSRAQGGYGGLRGSNSGANGNQGTSNIGGITGYSHVSNSNILDVFLGIPVSYIFDRILTSTPGTGGSLITPYSTSPTTGQGGCAVVTFFE
jgi:hypothetical protein